MGPAEMKTIAAWIGEVLAASDSEDVRVRVKAQVAELAAQFPLY